MTATFKQESTVVSNTLQINVRKEDFLKAITAVVGALGQKATLPILNNLLLQTNGPDEIFLAATDLELGVKTRCPATVLLQGAVTVPARKLYEIVRELASGEVEVMVGKNNAVNIKTGRSFFKVMGLEADDFPKLPEPVAEQSFELNQQTLKQCLSLTSFAISRDEARFALNGVLIVLRGKTIRFVATDGKRLAYIEKGLEQPTESVLEIIVPAKAVFELIKMLSAESGKVRIAQTQNQIVFQTDEATLTSRLIEGKFPNYEQVIPKEEKTRTHVNREELLSATKRVALLTSQENQAVKFDFIKDRLLISSRSANVGEAKEEIPVDVTGDDLTIGFNPNYVIDALKNLEVEEISLSMTDPDKPGLIKTNDGYLYVIMPMQLS